MRKSPFLTALFSGVRGDILAACMIQPEKWWFLTELAAYLRATPSTLQRDLRSFVQSGILETRREGTRVYFKANEQAPIFPELHGLIEKTAGVIPVLNVLLEPFRERICCAFIYGSVAKCTEHAASDLDLMVIGDVGLAELSSPLRRAEERLGREVNASVFSVREFQSRFADGDHFVSSVLRNRVEFVRGTKHDMDTIVGRQRRAETSHVETGNRKPPRARRA